MISLRFFLPDGFQTKAHYEQEAEIILNAIGDRKIPSDVCFVDQLGKTLPGQMYELTDNIQVRIRDGATTVFLRTGELLLFHVTEQVKH